MNKFLSFGIRATAGYILILLNFPIAAAVFYTIFSICLYNPKQFQQIQDVAIFCLGVTNFYFHIVAAQKMKWIKPLNYCVKYVIVTIVATSITVIFFYFDATIMIRWLQQKIYSLVVKDLYFATVCFLSQYFIWNLHWSTNFPIQLLVWYLIGWLVYFIAHMMVPIHLLCCVLYTLIMKQSIFRFVTQEIWTVTFRITCFSYMFGSCQIFYPKDPVQYITNVIFFMGHLHMGFIYVSLTFTLEIQKIVLKNRIMIYPYICFCYFWALQLAVLNFYIYRKIFVPYFLHKYIGKEIFPIDNLYNTAPSGFIARLFFCLIFSEKKETKVKNKHKKQTHQDMQVKNDEMESKTILVKSAQEQQQYNQNVDNLDDIQISTDAISGMTNLVE